MPLEMSALCQKRTFVVAIINEVVCAQQEISANRQSNADDATVVEIAATTHANIAPKR